MNTIKLTDNSWVRIAKIPSDRLEGVLAYYVKHLQWRQNEYRMYGKLVKSPRLVALMGDRSYAYSGIKHDPQPWDAQTQGLLSLCQSLLGAEKYQYNGVLLNLYRDGQDSLGMHLDNERELDAETPMISVSVGATRTFVVAGEKLRLAHGDIMLMGGDFHKDCPHGVPKEQADGPRVNLTFRRFK